MFLLAKLLSPLFLVLCVHQVNLSEQQETMPSNMVNAPENDCEFNWRRFEDKCFYFLGTSTTHTFSEAIYECNKYYKASLATIKSVGEQKFVEELLKSSDVSNNVWLGAKFVPAGRFVSGPSQGQPPSSPGDKDITVTGEVKATSGYYWIDGQPIDYHNKLLSAELIRGNHTMCIAMFSQKDYLGIWTPFNCNYYFHVLCERDLKSSSLNLRASTGTLIALAITLALLSL